jgi:hypothetical protein
MKTAKDHKWPHPTLPKIHLPGQRPTRDLIQTSIAQLHANAASIISPHGRARGGLIGLTVSGAEYASITQTPGDTWVWPDPVPDLVGFFTDGARRDHKKRVQDYDDLLEYDTTLRIMWTETGDDAYFRGMKQAIIGYQEHTCRTLVTHILDKYAKMDEKE